MNFIIYRLDEALRAQISLAEADHYPHIVLTLDQPGL